MISFAVIKTYQQGDVWLLEENALHRWNEVDEMLLPAIVGFCSTKGQQSDLLLRLLRWIGLGWKLRHLQPLQPQRQNGQDQVSHCLTSRPLRDLVNLENI